MIEDDARKMVVVTFFEIFRIPIENRATQLQNQKNRDNIYK